MWHLAKDQFTNVYSELLSRFEDYVVWPKYGASIVIGKAVEELALNSMSKPITWKPIAVTNCNHGGPTGLG